MPIQRSTAGCDQRRRRVLMEEHLHGRDAESPSDPSRDEGPSTVRFPGRRYGEEASADHQQPLTAIVPKHPATLVVLLLSGLVLIAMIQVAYGRISRLPDDHLLRTIRSLDVQSAGGLASWCSSILLLAAAVQGFQIYRLRRHRSDDYRGRYRVWVWVSPLLLGISLIAGTHLGSDVLALASARSDVFASFDPRIVGLLVPVLLGTPIAVRVMFEVRESRAAWLALAGASLAFGSAALIGLLGLERLFSLPVALTLSALTMLGHLSVLMTVAAYSRYVYLDAHGLLAPRVPAEQPAQPAAVAAVPTIRRESGVASAAETASAPASAPASASAPAPAAAPASDSDASASSPSAVEADDQEDSSSQLSKSERRRQKKLKRREPLRKAA